MKKLTIYYSILFCVIYTHYAYSYEIDTHERIAVESLVKTNHNEYLKKLDLQSLDHLLRYSVDNYDIKRWLELGAEEEDDHISSYFFRYKNHFYDPVFKRGLSHGIHNGLKSPDWGLEDTYQYGGQDYSWRDARQYFYDGLTTVDNPVDYTQTKREHYLARTFYTLGHIVHLIHDMAQPQHTRNDAHGGLPSTGDKSHYEEYTKDKQSKEPGLQYSGYQAVEYKTPRRFWETDNEGGLANYSNRGFVTYATNFDNVYSYSSPSIDEARSKLKIEPANALLASKKLSIPSECLPPYEPCVMAFFGTTVVDKYNHEATKENERTSTYSIFSQHLTKHNKTITRTDPDTGQTYVYNSVFSLNRFNYDEAHKLLIPRATAYSAGLIDYFFRGKFEVAPPDEGVYSVIDHSRVNKKDTDGFTLVKLKLKNVTPDINDNGVVPQDMTNGKLLAVVKFRRNICYEPDLSGEFNEKTSPNWSTWNGCALNSYRTTDVEIVKSDEITSFNLPSAVNNPDAEWLPISFKFQESIPINATDVKFQVVYRGQLGSEMDAVVVTTIDMKEPTYTGYFNLSDYNMVDGSYYTQDEILADPYLKERAGVDALPSYTVNNVKLYINSDKPIAEVPTIPVGQYVRIAFLTDKNTIPALSRYTKWTFHGKINQDKLNSDGSYSGQTTFSPTDRLRGTYYWSIAYTWWCNYTKWHCKPSDKEERKALSEIPPTEFLDPIPVNIYFKP